MEPVHIHLLLNHVPVFASLAGTALLAWAIFRKNPEFTRLALIVLVLSAIIAIPVYLTGEPAEEVVESLPGVSEAIIEEHEDAGKIALIAQLVMGAISLVALFLSARAHQAARLLIWLVLAAAVASSGLIAWTANLGGQIRHTEIRAGNAAGSQESPTQNRSEREDDDH